MRSRSTKIGIFSANCLVRNGAYQAQCSSLDRAPALPQTQISERDSGSERGESSDDDAPYEADDEDEGRQTSPNVDPPTNQERKLQVRFATSRHDAPLTNGSDSDRPCRADCSGLSRIVTPKPKQTLDGDDRRRRRMETERRGAEGPTITGSIQRLCRLRAKRTE